MDRFYLQKSNKKQGQSDHTTIQKTMNSKQGNLKYSFASQAVGVGA